MSELDLKKFMIMNAYLIHNGSSIMDIFYCPHDWDEGCFCRKPKAGLFFMAQKKYNINYLKHILSEMIFAMKLMQKMQVANFLWSTKKGLKI